MKIVKTIEETLIAPSTEIHINGDWYTGYITAITKDAIEIENYDMENQVINIADIESLKNMDELIIFRKEGKK